MKIPPQGIIRHVSATHSLWRMQGGDGSDKSRPTFHPEGYRPTVTSLFGAAGATVTEQVALSAEGWLIDPVPYKEVTHPFSIHQAREAVLEGQIRENIHAVSQAEEMRRYLAAASCP